MLAFTVYALQYFIIIIKEIRFSRVRFIFYDLNVHYSLTGEIKF